MIAEPERMVEEAVQVAEFLLLPVIGWPEEQVRTWPCMHMFNNGHRDHQERHVAGIDCAVVAVSVMYDNKR